MDIIDSDQHLYETRSLWAEFIDPGLRHEALSIVDDDLGYPWLTWRGRGLDLADVQVPGDTAQLGRHRQRLREQQPPEYRYDEALPAHYWEPAVRAKHLDVGRGKSRLNQALGHRAGCERRVAHG